MVEGEIEIFFGGGIIRLDSKGLTKLSNGFRQISLFCQCHAEVNSGFGGFGIELDCGGELGDGLGQFSLAEQEQSKVDAGFDETWIEPDG